MFERLAGLMLLAVGLAGAGSALIVASVVMVYISSFGLIYPNAAHEAVHPLPEIAGLAVAALGGVLAAALYRDASPLALGAIMSAAAVAAAALYAFWLRGKIADFLTRQAELFRQPNGLATPCLKIFAVLAIVHIPITLRTEWRGMQSALGCPTRRRSRH